MSPDIRAVMRNIDGNIPHETDTALLAIILELLPLLEEFELPILVLLHLRRQLFRPLGYRLRIPHANPRIPQSPHASVVRIFAGHEEGVVVEPGTGAFAKTVEGRALRARCVGKESLSRPA